MHIAVFTTTERPEAVNTDAPAANDSGAGDSEAPKRRLARLVVGPRLCAAREFSGYSQTEAAKHLGYSTSAQLSQHEQGKRLMPLPELMKAAEVYAVSTDYLLGLTSEPERDPASSLRAATVRGLRGLLDGLAGGLVDSIGAHAAAVGPDVVLARTVLSAGQALIDALAVLQRQAEFDEMKGGAAVARLSSEFEARLHETRRAIEKFDRLDLALRERVASAIAANDAERGVA
nr:helix-turn-helix transcriptional regulator [Variovorax sp. dw_954]